MVSIMAQSNGTSGSEAWSKSLPDLQLVSDHARLELADILNSVPGKKNIVIQPDLMSLLDHVTPFTFLKKYDARLSLSLSLSCLLPSPLPPSSTYRCMCIGRYMYKCTCNN